MSSAQVSIAPEIDPAVASHVGGRTLEVFTNTPRFNVWLYSKLSQHVRGSVLEVGSGIGNLSGLILRNADTAVFTDMEPQYLQALRGTYGHDPRVTVTEFNLDSEAPEAVARHRDDTIVAVNVIEHIRDDRALVQRLAALLKPAGKLVVYVPACPFAYGSLDRALGHYRRYTPDTLLAVLESAALVAEPPVYMNLMGLLGWTVNGRLIRRQSLSERQLALFERLMPLVALEDRFRLPLGLGIYSAAQKPG
jgi:SAM-dependent methyltransferase